MPDYPPAPGYPSGPGYPVTPDYPPASRYPAPPGYPETPGYPPTPGSTPAAGYPSPAGYLSAVRANGEGGEARQAMLAYLTVPFFGFMVPFAMYVIALRRSRWLRGHAAQALNVWITGLLYDVSAAILGTVLALDSPTVALVVVLPLLVLLWLVTVGYLIRAASAASWGREFVFPHWLCAPIVR